MITRSKQPPDQFCVELHKRSKRTRRINRRKQPDWVSAEHARVGGDCFPVRTKVSENDIICVHLLRDMQHGGAAQFSRRWQAVVIHLAETARVGVTLLAARR